MSLGPKARLISAWGIAPGIVTPTILTQAPMARSIAFDKYVLGAAMSCSRNLGRAFSPHFMFFDLLPGALPQAGMRMRPLALTEDQATPASKIQDAHPLKITPRKPGRVSENSEFQRNISNRLGGADVAV